MTPQNEEQSDAMSTRGDQIRERRERLGIGKRPFAEMAGVNRNTLAAIESGGGFHHATIAKIERLLTDLETEAGIHTPAVESTEEGLVEFEVSGDRIVVRGPVADADQLARMVAKLIRETRESDTRHP